MNTPEYIPSIAMSIQAHPDDQEFTIAGTLAKWARQGCRVISVIVTSGDAGSNEPSKGADYKSSLALLREDEQIAANLVLGIQETAFLHYPWSLPVTLRASFLPLIISTTPTTAPPQKRPFMPPSHPPGRG